MYCVCIYTKYLISLIPLCTILKRWQYDKGFILILHSLHANVISRRIYFDVVFFCSRVLHCVQNKIKT